MTKIDFNFTKDLIFKLVLQAVPEAAIELAKEFIPNMENLVYNPQTFIIDNPINREGINFKTTEFDFKFSLSDEKAFEYEMQNLNPGYDLKSRILKYYGDLIYSSFPKNQNYSHKKCYSAWFLKYNLFNDDKPIRTFYLTDECNNKLLDYASITIVEFAKISEEEYNKDVWKRLFITDDLDSLRGVDEVMDKVADKILDYNSDKAIREQLRAEEEWQRGKGEAIRASKEEGLAEGMAKANLDTAKKLLNLGVSIEIISKSTGLTIEEIKKL